MPAIDAKHSSPSDANNNLRDHEDASSYKNDRSHGDNISERPLDEENKEVTEEDDKKSAKETISLADTNKVEVKSKKDSDMWPTVSDVGPKTNNKIAQTKILLFDNVNFKNINFEKAFDNMLQKDSKEDEA